MKATFQNTVDILVKAYLNGTLAHGDCAACAVGNIIAAKVGAKVDISDIDICGGEWIRNGNYLTIGWNEVFVTREGQQLISPHNYFGQIKLQIDASGYSWQDLAKIEFAFESAEKPEGLDYAPHREECLNEEWMFNGLMAVVDVLAEIHGISLESKESAKALFVKA